MKNRKNDFFGIKLRSNRKLTLQEYYQRVSGGTLPMRGKKLPADRVYIEYTAYTDLSKKLRKLGSALRSSVKVHKYIFNNSILMEFANLQTIDIQWIQRAHERCEHPPIFGLGEGEFYLWKNEISEDEAGLIDPDILKKTKPLSDIPEQVLSHFQMWQASTKDLLKKVVAQKHLKTLGVVRPLGEMNFSKDGKSLLWSRPAADFEQALLRDFSEFYYTHQYCLDLLRSCNNCDKFFISGDERKTFCSPSCRDRKNNLKKKVKKLPIKR